MTNWCLCLLLVALVVRVSDQLCTIEEFGERNALDLVQTTESSEADQNFTVQEINYNCLSTSRIIGLYTTMSVSILYIRSDHPGEMRDVRYNMLCVEGVWLRTGRHLVAFTSNETRFDCSDCGTAINESDHHCTRELLAVVLL